MLSAARMSLAEIEAAPRATERQAARAAELIVGYYPQAKIANPDVYLRGIRAVLAGARLDLVLGIADPKRGIVVQSNFLPSLAQINEWMANAEARFVRAETTLRNEIDTLCGAEPKPSTQERETRYERLTSVSKAMRSEKPSGPEWMLPDDQRTEADKRDDERLKRCQRSDTPENRASLLDTEIMRGGKTESDAA